MTGVGAGIGARVAGVMGESVGAGVTGLSVCVGARVPGVTVADFLQEKGIHLSIQLDCPIKWLPLLQKV